MQATKDYYEILGVSAAADEDVIRAAYRALMSKYHPDKNASADAQARAAEITEAFFILGKQASRVAYDAARRPRTEPVTPTRRPATRRSSTRHRSPGRDIPLSADAKDSVFVTAPALWSRAGLKRLPHLLDAQRQSLQSAAHDNRRSLKRAGRWLIALFLASVLLILLYNILSGLLQTRPSFNVATTHTPAVRSTVLEPGTGSSAPMIASTAPSPAMQANSLPTLQLDNGVSSAAPAGLEAAYRPQMRDDHLSNAVSRFAVTFYQTGMTGAITISKRCHALAASEKTVDRVDYCNAFDDAGAYLERAGATLLAQTEPDERSGYFATTASQATQLVAYGSATSDIASMAARPAHIAGVVEPMVRQRLGRDLFLSLDSTEEPAQ